MEIDYSDDKEVDEDSLPFLVAVTFNFRGM